MLDNLYKERLLIKFDCNNRHQPFDASHRLYQRLEYEPIATKLHCQKITPHGARVDWVERKYCHYAAMKLSIDSCTYWLKSASIYSSVELTMRVLSSHGLTLVLLTMPMWGYSELKSISVLSQSLHEKVSNTQNRKFGQSGTIPGSLPPQYLLHFVTNCCYKRFPPSCLIQNMLLLACIPTNHAKNLHS